jgi:hypothetical protein
MPGCLRPVARQQLDVVADALFLAMYDALRDLAQEHLGAQLAVTAMLHTWARDLRFHPHVHALVSGGGLTKDGGTWVPSRPRFLFPQRQMAAKFQLYLVRRLRTARRTGRLPQVAGNKMLDNRTWRAMMDKVHLHRSVVFMKATDHGVQAVLDYLGRYVSRVALSNHRLISVTDDAVVFRGRNGPVRLSPHTFLDRFAQHILPSGFRKVRHYGLYAPGNVNRRLLQAQARCEKRYVEEHGEAPPAPPQVLPVDATVVEKLLALLGVEVGVCTRCGGQVDRRPLERVAAKEFWPECWWET